MMQNKNIKLGKKGVNYVSTIVDNNNCNFHSFIQENDIGIDGIIELFTKSCIATSKLISVQIKTGRSYYDDNYCFIPIEKHTDYWKFFSLPVIGIVCTVDESNNVNGAYWEDIKDFINSNPGTNRIKFEKTNKIKFDMDDFYFVFCSNFIAYDQIREMTFEEAINIIGNTNCKSMGLFVLATKYSNKVEAWELLFNYYYEQSEYLNLSFFYDSLTYIFSHPDHWISSDKYQFSEESKMYVLNKLRKFNESDIETMLKLA